MLKVIQSGRSLTDWEGLASPANWRRKMANCARAISCVDTMVAVARARLVAKLAGGN